MKGDTRSLDYSSYVSGIMEKEMETTGNGNHCLGFRLRVHMFFVIVLLN